MSVSVDYYCLSTSRFTVIDNYNSVIDWCTGLYIDHVTKFVWKWFKILIHVTGLVCEQLK